MKIEIWNEPTVEEPALRLRLFSNGKTATLSAVDKNGNGLRSANLMTISPGGYYPIRYISEDIGIALDGDGRMILRTAM